MKSQDPTSQSYFASHPRLWRDFHYVYPVISRRSKGLSIGVNLNVDKVCNFDCIYCCVDRSVTPPRKDVDLDQLREELDAMVSWAGGGEIWETDDFKNVPPELRHVRDITFSGDGEPTSFLRFAEACQIAADARTRHGLDDARLIVHTDSSLLHRDHVKEGIAILDANNGEVWAKLDGGTTAYYRLVNRSKVPFQQVLDNILACGREREIVIQALFMTVHGEPLPDEEFDAFCERLRELIAGGCRVSLVQIYTVARNPAEAYAQPLPNEHLDRLVAALQRRLPDLLCEPYYGVE
ncbi:MAG: radical SAM protein [Verrucomicrobia bacterium]|nr:radical SAM protein [Verrucomicrobiota bacterium]MDA1087698.1 radical SAM protein [Verrucomicrobiota bacterium]